MFIWAHATDQHETIFMFQPLPEYLFIYLGKERLVKDIDQSCVTVRPKFYVGSSGCVWGSDLLRIRYEKPELFEMSSDHREEKSIQEKKICAMVRDAAFYYSDSTTEDDLKSLSTAKSAFKQYESERVRHFSRRIEMVKVYNDTEILELTNILEEAMNLVKEINKELQGDNMGNCCKSIKSMKETCDQIINLIDSMNTPQIKPIISEYTDGGPGVGVSNIAVRFRFAEMSRIQNSVRRVRIHRASGDSAQNEAERTNSAIGKS